MEFINAALHTQNWFQASLDMISIEYFDQER